MFPRWVYVAVTPLVWSDGGGIAPFIYWQPTKSHLVTSSFRDMGAYNQNRPSLREAERRCENIGKQCCKQKVPDVWQEVML